MHVAYIDGFVLLTVVQNAVLSAGGVLQLVEDLQRRETSKREERRESVSCCTCEREKIAAYLLGPLAPALCGSRVGAAAGIEPFQGCVVLTVVVIVVRVAVALAMPFAG